MKQDRIYFGNAQQNRLAVSVPSAFQNGRLEKEMFHVEYRFICQYKTRKKSD